MIHQMSGISDKNKIYWKELITFEQSLKLQHECELQHLRTHIGDGWQ